MSAQKGKARWNSSRTLHRPRVGRHVRSYSTRFENDEAPISEAGLWDNGKRGRD